MSDAATICPDCHNAIPARALGGLCPFCLASSVADELESRTPFGPVVVGAASYEQIGPYRILDRLGEGGYGVVYRAEQERPLRRRVAVKIMKAGAMSEQGVARFEAERQALALMEHPSIAHVYDVGETAEGLPYFVMELIEGVPINTYCDENALSRDERLRLFRQVCEAVAHAHRRGIIHRDLKPSNILVTEESGEPLPKVIDFGIAKATETLLTERTLVTRDHQLVGTPAYMSPEQAEMRGGAIDMRADIYSLGVILYELLTGTTPFRIEELASLPYDEALRKVRTEDPQRPSSRCRELTRSGEFAVLARRDVQLQAATDLDWIVMKALEKQPERRYETAAALSRDIACFLEGEAIEARPPTTTYLLGKFVRRHCVPVLAAAAVLVAMVVGTIVSLGMYFRAEQQARRAERNEERAAEQAQLAVESDERGRWMFSSADFSQARPLLADRKPGLAVAHLARAVRTSPGNTAAATKLLTTLASENWAAPQLTLPIAGSGRLAFTPGGSEILFARNAIPDADRIHQEHPFLQVFSAADGREVRRIDLEADQTVFEISPDGATVAVATALGAISIWELGSGARRVTLAQSLPIGPSQVRYSRDGSMILAAYHWTGRLQVWDVSDGTRRAEFQLPGSDYLAGCADFSVDGRAVVFAYGTDLRVFDLASGEARSPLMQHDGEILGVASLPMGGQVVSWSADGSARVWDTESGRLVRLLSHEREIAAGTVSPDGSRLLTGTGGRLAERGTVRLWDLTSGDLLGTPIEHPGGVTTLAFSADGLKAASGSHVTDLGDRAVQVIDALTGEPILAPIFHPRGCSAMAFNPDGSLLAVASRHLEAVVWSVRPAAMRPLRIPHPKPVWRAVFDDSGERPSLLTLTFGGVARRWDALTGEALSEPETSGPVAVAAHAAAGDDTLRQGLMRRRWVGSYIHAHPRQGSKFRQLFAPEFSKVPLHAAAASEDGRFLATGCADGMIRVWDLSAGALALPPLAHGSGPVTALAINASGTLLASGGMDGEARLWDLPTSTLLRSVAAHPAGSDPITNPGVTALAISPDESVIAAGSGDGGVRLWWPGRSPGLSARLDHAAMVNHLAFRPDGLVLAASGQENAARVWDAETARSLARPMRHIDGATYGLFLLWTPDGQRLVTAGGSDNTARIWDPATGHMTVRPLEHPTSATAIALRPGGGSFLFASRVSRVWDIRSGEPLTPALDLGGDEGATSYSAAFDRAGERFATGTHAGEVLIHDLPRIEAALPEWVLAYAEARGGFRFNAHGVLEQVPGSQLGDTRERIRQETAGRDDSLGRWTRWLVAEGDHQTLAPGSGVPHARYVEDLVRQDTAGSLREALLLRPGDPLLMGKLGYRLVTQPQPSLREILCGGFLVRRAVDLAPGNADLQWMRGLVVLQERLRGITPGK